MSASLRFALPQVCSRRCIAPLVSLPSVASRSISSSPTLAAPKSKKVSQKSILNQAAKTSERYINKPYALPLAEAHRLLRAYAIGRPNAKLITYIKVTPDKQIPSMRGRVYFPHNPSTQESRIYVICGFQDEKAALDAGAALAGGKELVDKILEEEVPLPTTVICTPAYLDMIKKNLGRYLGQKRLMPSEKLGTVTTDIPQAIADNALTVEWKATREGNIDATIARPSFTLGQLLDNLEVFLHDIRNCAGGEDSMFERRKLVNIEALQLRVSDGPSYPITDVVQKRLEDLAQ